MSVIATSRIQAEMTKAQLSRLLEVDVKTLTLMEGNKIPVSTKDFEKAMMAINNFVSKK